MSLNRNQKRDKLKEFIRLHHKGGCKLFSNPDCECPLCCVDDLADIPANLERDVNNVIYYSSLERLYNTDIKKLRLAWEDWLITS